MNFVMALVQGDEVASFGDACAVAGFTISVVFGVLLLICLLIKLFTKIISAIEKLTNKASKTEAPAPAVAVATTEAASEEEFSSGSLKLKNCDEKTAAMIMAIVSDNTGIPLSELVFKSIKLVEKN